MQGFIFISFILISLFNARFRFHLISSFWGFLGGLSLHLNHLIASCTANYDWPFGTLPFGLFWSNLDTRDLETYPRTALLNLFWIFEYLTWGPFAGPLSDVFPDIEKLAGFCSIGYFEF